MAARHLALGAAGEDAAAAWLAARGYRIVERNWRAGAYELDLVCRHQGMLVFVEVKTRGPGSRGTPADGLTPAKAQRLLKAASHYLTAHQAWDSPCRFDLVMVTPESDGARYVCQVVVDVIGAEGLGWQPF